MAPTERREAEVAVVTDEAEVAVGIEGEHSSRPLKGLFCQDIEAFGW